MLCEFYQINVLHIVVVLHLWDEMWMVLMNLVWYVWFGW